MFWSKTDHSQKEAREQWIKDTRARLPLGSEIEILGRKLRIVRHGFYDGSAFFDGGFEAAYFDDSGIMRREFIYPADVDGFFPAAQCDPVTA